MPSLGNIGVRDFVPNFGDQVGQLVPDGPEDADEWFIAAISVLGFWSSLVIAVVGAIGVGAEFLGASMPSVLEKAYTFMLTVPGIGEVPFLPWLSLTGLLAFTLLVFGVSTGRFTNSTEMVVDDAVPTVFYYTIGLVFVLMNYPDLAPLAEAAVWPLVLFGIVAWVISAAATRVRA